MYSNCTHCGTFSRVNRLRVCPSCHEVDEHLLQQTREIISREGSMSVFDLADRLSIEPERIFRWMHNGQISSRCFRHTCPLCGNDMMHGACQCTKRTYVDSITECDSKNPEKFHFTRKLQQRRDRYWDRISKIVRKQKRDMWLFSD